MDGPLKAPVFGKLPPRPAPARRPPAEFKFASILGKLREYPHQPAMIAVYDEGSKDDTARHCAYNSNKIYNWLRKNYPLEAWELHTRRVMTHFCRRELWACYHGVLTPDEAFELEQIRASQYVKGVNKKRQAEAKNRLLTAARDPHQREATPGV